MKTIILSMSMLVSMSLTTNTNHELNEAINDIEDYIEWLNEDLFQGEITQEEYDIMLENYNGTLKHLRYVLDNIKTN